MFSPTSGRLHGKRELRPTTGSTATPHSSSTLVNDNEVQGAKYNLSGSNCTSDGLVLSTQHSALDTWSGGPGRRCATSPHWTATAEPLDRRALCRLGRRQPLYVIFNPLLHYQHPPGYRLALHIWMGASTGESWIRLFPALAGIALIPVAWALARALWPRQPVAAGIVALLVATCPFLLHYSQDATNYSWTILWAAASALALLYAWRTDGAWAWAAWTASIAIALYSHYFALFPVLAEAILVACAGIGELGALPQGQDHSARVAWATRRLPSLRPPSFICPGSPYSLPTATSLAARSIPSFGTAIPLSGYRSFWLGSLTPASGNPSSCYSLYGQCSWQGSLACMEDSCGHARQAI